MATTMTSTEERIHFAPTVITIGLADSDAIDALEVCNVEVGDGWECFELGPFTGNEYLRLRCRDNVAFAAKLRGLADDLQDGTFDERERKAEAERHDCPGCRTRLDADDLYCGRERCRRIVEQEQAYEALGLL